MVKQKNIANYMKASAICFLIYFFLKPFYIFGSGSIQPGDCFLLLSFAFVIFENKEISMKDKLFYCFVLCVAIVNCTYYFYYQASDFLKSTTYYIFNLFGVICFRNLMRESRWLNSLLLVCKINLLVQLLIYFAKLGDYWHGTYRYMGTYRDPNQMGFAVLSTLAIIFLLDEKRKYIYFIISSFLIFQTASMGMLIALLLMASLDLLSFFKGFFIKKFLKHRFILYLLLFVGISFILSRLNLEINLSKFRIEEKINIGGSLLQSFIDDRGLNVAFEYPLYFIFGYGEGFKFERYGYSGEMHSTWFSLSYYYGIIPFTILLKWIYNNIKEVSKKYIPVYVAIFIEAFTLINHRQPSFWMIIMLGTLVRGEKNED